MTLSGWCASPPGARPHCGECVSLRCSCACHHDQTCPACLAPVLSDTHHTECVAPLDVLSGESLSTQGESGPYMIDSTQANRPLGGASTPLIQGASPTTKESTSA